MPILAAWQPIEVISLVSILVTGAIGGATIVTNHLREKDLHRRTIEAERAKPYREAALDVVAYAREATYECHPLTTAPLPSSRTEVTSFVERFETATLSILRAEQAATRFATLGWNDIVRAEAKQLHDLLLKLSVSLFMPRSIAKGQAPSIPEGPAIAAGDPGFWGRWQSGLKKDIEATEQKIREYETAISQ